MPAAPVAALTVVLILLAGAPAVASTALVETGTNEDADGNGIGVSDVKYLAAPGETNAVTVADTPAGFVFTDAGARITPGPGCTARDEHTVLCKIIRDDFGYLSADVDLGDGDDRVDIGRSKAPIGVSGGPGDDTILTASAGSLFGDAGNDSMMGGTFLSGGDGEDRLVAPAAATAANLTGGAGADTLIGGPGADTLDGGPGADQLSGGAGHDVLNAADAPSDGGPETLAADTVDGGPGNDIVDYGGRRRPVVVTIGSPTVGGSAGEGDVLTSIEGAMGGLGDDLLTGDDRPNELDGGGGSDRIDARGGNDRVNTRPVGDFTAGNDDTPSVGTADITCGAGIDAVIHTSTLALLRPDCEKVGSAKQRFAAQPTRIARSTVTFGLPCAAIEVNSPLRLFLPGRRAFWASGGPGPGVIGVGKSTRRRTGTCVVRLNPRGRRLLATRRQVLAVVVRDDRSWAVALRGRR